MRAANNNRLRDRFTITVETREDGAECLVSLVSLNKGSSTGETVFSEAIDISETALAYAQSMARHFRCPVVHLIDHRRRYR